MMQEQTDPSHDGRISAGSERKTLKLLHERNWTDHLYTIREHWILALLVALCASGFYVYKSLQAVPLYKSAAIYLFEPSRDRIINIQGVVDNSGERAGSLLIRNHLTDLRSNSFRARVVDSLTSEEKELITRDYGGDGEDATLVHNVVADANKISLIGGNIFNFEFHHRNPQAAALLANRFSEEFNDFLLERARKSNEAALRFLRSQSEELKLKVERSELAVQQYRQDRNLVSLEESQNLIVERMKNLSSNLNSAKIELLNYESAIKQIEETGMDLAKLAELPSIKQMGTLPSKFLQRNNLVTERSSLALRYGRRHPRMVENAAALESIEADIRSTVEKNVADLYQQQRAAQSRVDSLSAALGNAEKESLDLDQVAIEYNVLRRKLETDERLFTQVHQRLNEAILASQLSETNLRLVDQAWAATNPFTPNTKKIYSTAAMLFTVCLLGVPFALHYLNLKLKTAMEIESQLQLPFLGEIRKLKRKSGLPHRIAIDQSDPQAAELFRQIHSQILLKIHQLEPGHTFVITSAIPKEGKSFFAINLAATFSRHHLRTLLVDSDFRRPTLAGRMKDLLEQAGATETDNPEPVAITERLHVLPSYQTHHEATELIQSEAFQDSLARLKSQYDVVVIDTPPAGLFPDAGLIGNCADHFIFLTQLNKHRKSALKGILNRLGESRATILGVVVNKVSRSRSRNLGAYRYADYSKYKNYYPTKPAPAPQPTTQPVSTP